MTQLDVPSTGRAGQNTQIEQARAMAEVAAARATAMENPRSTSLARDRMQDTCSMLALAERGFYRFPRGGQVVTGPSVYLARELARCWGNIRYGIKELYRNDFTLESEMLAYAEDLETNTRSENGFIVPHKRDVGGKVVPLIQMRDIYENNANAGARRMRETIYAVLPLWFRHEAEEICRATIERGADPDKQPLPLQQRKDNAIHVFSKLGITLQQLEDKIGQPEGRWRAVDVAGLSVIRQSLKAGETTLELEFPSTFTRAEDIARPAAVPALRPGEPTPVEQWADPSSAQDPVPPDTVCDICTAVGKHYQDECPTVKK